MKHIETILSAAVLLSLAGGVARAEMPEVYSLGPVIVTAERTDTEELKTPSAVNVVTAEDIEKTGAANVQEALKFSTGIITSSQGPKGLAQGVMTAKAVIRGVEKGTLVLVDGVPINQSGMYSLQDISTDSVKKIEIVRGGGAVLYGSEAAGGVINIITGGTRPTKVKAGFGNYGQQNYVISAQAGDRFGITYEYDHLGKVNHITHPDGGRPAGMYYNVTRAEHNHLDWRYNMTEDLYFTHSYSENSNHYVYRWDGRNGKFKDADYKDVIYSNKEHVAGLHYNNGSLKGNLYYHKRNITSRTWAAKKSPAKSAEFDPAVRAYTSSEHKDETFGLDLSKRWQFDRGSFMIGGDFRRDMADVDSKKTRNHYDRNMYSLYGQLAYDFTKAFRANVNLRQTWYEKDDGGNKYDKFTPELVLMHDLGDSAMVYVKAGKSFMMPTFKQLYGGGNIIPSPGLKPQSGTHYEAGYKKNIGKSSWRFAAFHYKIKDSMEAKVKAGEITDVKYTNEDVKNTGVELEWSRRQNENLSYHLGLTLSHPEKQERSKKGVLGDWHDYYGKVQLSGGVSYTRGKLRSSFAFSHLGRRIRDHEPYESYKSQWITDLDFSYQANRSCRFFLNIDNVFNRHDIVSSSTSTFWNLGRNFMAGVEYTF